MNGRSPAYAALALAMGGCTDTPNRPPADVDLSGVTAEVTAAVQAFHAADTARNAEAVAGLLWPEYTMLVDGRRLGHAEIVDGARKFMASLESFHTEWTDLEVIPLSGSIAVASFQFRDSIITSAGDTLRSRGPTTFIWTRRAGEWRLLFGDADHYSIGP
jgi:ketosteroid isomerase-like protein